MNTEINALTDDIALDSLAHGGSQATRKKKPKDKKWQPEHFPAGTVVRLMHFKRNYDGKVELKYSSKEDGTPHTADVTVVSVCNNGLNSWLINTDEPPNQYTGPRVFNFAHVGSVVKRGAGLVVYEPQRHTRRNTNYKWGFTHSVAKSRYFWIGAPYEVLDLIGTSLGLKLWRGGYKLRDGFFEHLMEQTFVRSLEREMGYPGVFSASKKRMRRFIQQNINRWLMPSKDLDALATARAKADYEDYCRDLDDDLLDGWVPDDKPEPGSVADSLDSDYSPDSGAQERSLCDKDSTIGFEANSLSLEDDSQDENIVIGAHTIMDGHTGTLSCVVGEPAEPAPAPRPYNAECRMNGCDLLQKCCWPDQCGPDGFITLGRIRKDNDDFEDLTQPREGDA